MDPRLRRYYVVEFVSAPLKGRYACVPVTWVKSPSIENRVLVAYPDADETTTTTHLLDQNQNAHQHDWKKYVAFIKHTTGSYGDAIAFVNRLRVDEGSRGRGVDTLRESEAPRRSQGGDPVNQQALRHIESNLTQPSLKRSSSTHNGDYIKRFRAAQTATSMSNANIQPHVESRKIACNVSNITTTSQKCPEIRQVHNENPQSPIQPSSSNMFSDQSILAEDINASFIELKKHLEEDALTADYMRKDIINRINSYNEFVKAENEIATLNIKLPYASIPKELLSAVQVVQTENTKDASYEADEMKERVPKLTLPPEYDPKDPRWTLRYRTPALGLVEQTEDTEDASSEADEMAERAPRLTLPPEYDPEISSWTLRYRTPALGLVELMPGRGIYIKSEDLARCKTKSRNCASLARMLMVEIFSVNALKVCSLAGTSRRTSQSDEAEPVRPGLNRHARTIILTYVETYGRQKGWPPMNMEAVKNSMRYKLKEIRRYYNITKK